ncbi:hypothetical protein ACFWNK_19670 [Streptomyces sp. NPDC058417]|uniref:hypothetical protein n=1 Tax=unclassified Streptomyces TaxID=2593676 RepID=UPI003662FCB2
MTDRGHRRGAYRAFAYLSNDPDYQPAEPRLDLAVRYHHAASLPTVTKPALLIHHGRPVVRTLPAIGTLSVASHSHTWTGSRQPPPHPAPSGHLTVYGATNCPIRYHDDPRTGFRRHVDPTANTTPRDPALLGCTVAPTPDGARITAVHPGGGADLFAGADVLRSYQPWPDHLVPGAPRRRHGHRYLRHRRHRQRPVPRTVRRRRRRRRTHRCLGPEPWHEPIPPRRPDARALLALDDRHLTLADLNGAPLAPTFQGVAVQEAAELCERAGHNSAAVFHLDGSQTSKIAYRHCRRPADAFGSLHYLRWPRHEREPFHWQGLDGRRLDSALQITPNQEAR